MKLTYAGELLKEVREILSIREILLPGLEEISFYVVRRSVARGWGRGQFRAKSSP